MTEENKTEEIKEEKIEEKVEEKTEEIKPSATTASSKIWDRKECRKKVCEFFGKNKKTIIATLVLVILIAGSYGYKVYYSKIDVGQDAIKAKVIKFVTANVPATAKVDLKDISKEGDLYKFTVTVNGQEVPAYATRDGKKLIQAQGVIDMDQTSDSAQASKQAAAPEKTEAEVKTDVPTVDLFVMSYCPFGLQMEKGLLPAVEALGNKIKFNLKFVDYTLHGQKEVVENVNQYCIEKTQQPKLDAYLKCFWKNSAGTSDACMKAVGINTAQVSSCVADTNKQFNPTEKAFDINKDENDKFGVQGSPTLVVNGTVISSGRDSAGVLKAICSGFTNQPKECSTNLSSTSPAAGFDDQAAAAASGSAAPASCSTPQK